MKPQQEPHRGEIEGVEREAAGEQPKVDKGKGRAPEAGADLLQRPPNPLGNEALSALPRGLGRQARGQVARAARQISLLPGPPNFRIGRLIANTNRPGFPIHETMDIEEPNFKLAVGNYLLYLKDDPFATRSRFRNIAGDAGIIPHRRIQEISIPWGLPMHLPLAENGTPIQITLAIEPGEHFLDLRGNEAWRAVLSVDRHFSRVSAPALNPQWKVNKFPWNLKVDTRWLTQWDGAWSDCARENDLRDLRDDLCQYRDRLADLWNRDHGLSDHDNYTSAINLLVEKNRRPGR